MLSLVRTALAADPDVDTEVLRIDRISTSTSGLTLEPYMSAATIQVEAEMTTRTPSPAPMSSGASTS